MLYSKNDPAAIAGQHPWYKDINKYQWSCLIAATLGWALDAFDNLLFTFTIPSLIKEWGINTTLSGMVVSFTLIASAIGGVLFGYIADRIGRVKSLTISILLFSIATGLCGLSQNIWQIMIARTLVGLGLGGEWSAGVTMISEAWPKEHRGKGVAIMQSGFAIGGMLASLVAGHIIFAYGWRALYFLGIIPALLVFYVRKNVKEPEIWLNNRKNVVSEEKKSNPRESIFDKKVLWRTVLGSAFVSCLMLGNTPSIFLPTFLAMPYDKGGAGASIVGSSLMIFPSYLGCFFGYLFFGILSDRVGRKKAFAIYLTAAALLAPGQIIAARHSIPLFLVVSPILGFFSSGCYAGLGPLLAELFPTRVRSTAVGFCYNFGRGTNAVSATIAGFFAATYGLANTLMFAGVFFAISVFVSFLFKETAGMELE